MEKPSPIAETPSEPDPLADLRQTRGWIDHMDEQELWAMLIRLDGDGQCEVHCNTMECTWPWLRQMIRTYRGVSKVYLPLYIAQFEFLFNRHHKNRWNRTLDLLQTASQVDAASAADLLTRVQSTQFAEVCPVAG